MLQHLNPSRFAAFFGLLSALFINPTSGAQTPPQNHAMIDWSADLSAAKDSSRGARALAVQTPATGTVTASLDSDHHTITFQGQVKNIVGVSRIELRAARSTGDLSGPLLATLFDTHDGPFTGTFTTTVPSQSFGQIAAAINNGQAAVVVTTSAHPDGEIAGFILMHKHYQH